MRPDYSTPRRADPQVAQPELQPQELPQHQEQVPEAPQGKKRKSGATKEAPKKIYFCAKPGCGHSFEPNIGRRPCYVQNGSFSKGAHKRSCGGGYRWLEVCCALPLLSSCQARQAC